MRPIKFRGMTKDGGWIYGDLFHDGGTEEVLIQYKASDSEYPKWIAEVIIPETVGEFTGLTDRNGREIFDGDRYFHNYFGAKCVVVFKNGSFWLKNVENEKHYYLESAVSVIDYLGTIHDEEEQ